MGWAASYITMLKKGETIQFRPRGNSMTPKIKSGQEVTVTPVARDTPIAVGDAVLCRVQGREFLHLVKAITNEGKRYTIGNMRGFVNGTIVRAQIYGIVTKVEP
jgi:hypothetical protein